MNNELIRICEVAEESRVTSGELYRLIKLVGDVHLEHEISGEWPDHFVSTTYGAIRSAAVLMAKHLNEMNDDLANELHNEVKRSG